MSYANQNGYRILLSNPPSSNADQLAAVELRPDHTTELWSSGLCDCCSDAELCSYQSVYRKVWITFGRIAEAVDEGQTSCVASAAIHALLTYFTGYGWKYSCMYRSKMRKKFSLGGSSFKDCLVHSFCETCALCQEYRELQFRGVVGSTDDDQKTYGAEVVPVAPKGMIR